MLRAYLPAGSTKWELIGHEKLWELNSLAFVCGYSPADEINSFIYFLFCNPSLLDAEVFHYSGHRWLGSRRRRVQTLWDHLLHVLRVGDGGMGNLLWDPSGRNSRKYVSAQRKMIVSCENDCLSNFFRHICPQTSQQEPESSQTGQQVRNQDSFNLFFWFS